MSHLTRLHSEELRKIETKLGFTIEELLKRIKVVSDYDRYITAPSFGFKTTNDYYRKASCVLKLTEVEIPMFFLEALDDPIVE